MEVRTEDFYLLKPWTQSLGIIVKIHLKIENYCNLSWYASTLIEFNYENAKSKKSSNAVSQSSNASVNQEINIIEFRTTDTKEVVSQFLLGIL